MSAAPKLSECFENYPAFLARMKAEKANDDALTFKYIRDKVVEWIEHHASLLLLEAIEDFDAENDEDKNTYNRLEKALEERGHSDALVSFDDVRGTESIDLSEDGGAIDILIATVVAVMPEVRAIAYS